MYQSTFSQLSGRITQAGEGDDVSVKHNALHYVTYGVPPQTLPQWVGGLSLQQVGSTPHLLPTHCVQYHQWYANILIALPSPLKRGRDEQRMKKGTRVRLSLRSTALRFSPPFFRDHSAPLSPAFPPLTGGRRDGPPSLGAVVPFLQGQGRGVPLP